MIGITNLFFPLFAMSLTGSVFYLLWLLVQKVMDRPGYTDAWYRSLHWIVYLFWIPITPVIHMILFADYRKDFVKRILLFELTGPMGMAVRAICVIWSAGICLYAATALQRYGIWRKIRKKAVLPDPELEGIDRVCREKIGLKEEARLYVIDGIVTSYVGGLLKPCIWLPSGRTGEEYRIMLCHEYMHIRHRDAGRKILAAATCVLYWWNPLVWRMRRDAEKWGELYGDFEAADYVSSVPAYCTLMYRLSKELEDDSPEWEMYGFSKKESFITERIERMKRREKASKEMRMKAFLALAAALVLGLTASAGGTGLIAKAQQQWYLNTMEVEDIDSGWEADTELQVYEEEDLAGFTIVDEEDTEDGIMPLASRQFTCFVDPTMLYRSAPFYVEAGTVIRILCGVTPGDLTISVGVFTPNNTYKLSKGSKSIFVQYTAETSGYYRIAILNGNAASATVEGTYTY